METRELLDFLSEFQGESDRACAVLLASYIDDLLQRLFMSKFTIEMSKSLQEQIFGQAGPLSTLSAKITMAHVLGYIGPDAHHDLTLIRKIRNEFAHKRGISFATDPIAGWCAGLRAGAAAAREIRKADPIVPARITSPRSRLELAAAALCRALWRASAPSADPS